LIDDLETKGFRNLIPWSRGVDLKQFYPKLNFKSEDVKTLLYVGRVSKEKNVEAFCEIENSDYKYIKIVVGDGPDLNRLKEKYKSDVMFLGEFSGKQLADIYRTADCFVFPSKNDTFGVVLIEALACGVPVAAYPVTGPIDILNEKVGFMDNDLSYAVKKALKLNREDCSNYAKKYDWNVVVDSFVENIIKTNSKL
jgi:glycosyltransferase involved in cell wall biosynthesis